MKFSLSPAYALTLALGLLPLSALAVPANPWDELQPDKEQTVASLNVVELLKRHHYSKPALDDERSSQIFDNYLKALDPQRSYFTAADVASFEPWRHQLDDYLTRGQLKPAYVIYKRQLQRMRERLNYAIGLLEVDFAALDFQHDEHLEIDREQSPWLEDAAALDDLWRKRVKDELLRLKLSGKEPQASRELLLKRYRSQLQHLGQTRSEDIFQTFINAFTETYDPHTNYLSPENAENFDINMSLSLEGIGAVLQSDNEYVKVVRLIPASPAEKSRQLHPADRVIGVAQGDGEMVDVIGWRLDEVVKLIRGPKQSVVRLEIIPASNAANDQSSKVISLTRDAVKLEDQAASKKVLNLSHDGHSYKLGVIEIPAFYLDFKAYRNGNPDYNSTTRDVRRLLTELKQEKVDGIILDLRNNGGGSLQEATELTGLFIEKGPTVLVRNGNGRVDVLADEDPEVYYDGPLVVLVNRLSASASEIFAGAMQDYHRALIVGGQTFGKGTVQTMQPLNHGELKLTLAKFYRVSGQSTQHQGVLPDISYPALVDTSEIGESSLPAAMPWDRIDPVINPVRDPLQPFISELAARHAQRTAGNPEFLYIRDRISLSQELAAEKSITLNEEKRRAWQESIEQRRLALENRLRTSRGEAALVKLEDEEAEEQKDEKLPPEKDAFLTESGHILLDYLSLRSPVASTREH